MMSETVLISILSVVTTLLGIVIGNVLGRRAERQRQTMLIRAEMLKPIEEWLQGAEKMIGILGDTLSSVLQNAPSPLMYDYEERKKAAQFMSEKTNVVMGILQSKSLQIGQTIKLAAQLLNTIMKINELILFQLLPQENEILECSQQNILSQDFITEIATLKLHLDSLIRESYSFIAQIKTALT
jgi:dsDNA-binding SOS-regulon protein